MKRLRESNYHFALKMSHTSPTRKRGGCANQRKKPFPRLRVGLCTAPSGSFSIHRSIAGDEGNVGPEGRRFYGKIYLAGDN